MRQKNTLPLVGWRVSKGGLIVASLRYRALLPAIVLSGSVCRSRFFTKTKVSNLRGLSCLVFVKAFSSDDYQLAQEAKLRGIPVVLDLCDNIFIEGYGKKKSQLVTAAQAFAQMATAASLVVASTVALAEVIRRHIPSSCKVIVIPDGLETPVKLKQMRYLISKVDTVVPRNNRWEMTLDYLLSKPRAHLLGLVGLLERAKIGGVKAVGKLRMLFSPNPAKASSSRAKLLWFGHHGAKYANFGMLDLLSIQADLESLAKELPIELVVVSNNSQKFQEFIQPFALPTRYVEWSSAALLREMRAAAVVIVPNSLDDFSICKSPNRAVTALLNGKPVVATTTPALTELSDCIVLDDFQGGILHYLSDAYKAPFDIHHVTKRLDSLYGDSHIREAWRQAFDLAQNNAASTNVMVIGLPSPKPTSS